MSEIWKQIPEHNNYEASNMGRIRRIGSTECLVPNYKGKGYGRLQIDYKKCQIHHLVLNTFVGPRQEGQETRHLNGIRSDNRLENLKWGTHQENIDDMLEHGTRFHRSSKRHHKPPRQRVAAKVINAAFKLVCDLPAMEYIPSKRGAKRKITLEQVEVIRKLRAGGMTTDEIATMFEVTTVTINLYLRRKPEWWQS